MQKPAHHLSSDRYGGFFITLSATSHNPTVSREAERIVTLEEKTDNDVWRALKFKSVCVIE